MTNLLTDVHEVDLLAIQLNMLVDGLCKDCGQVFLSSWEYKRYQQTHLETHIDSWSKLDKVSWKLPNGMNQDLLKIFEKHRLGELYYVSGLMAN